MNISKVQTTKLYRKIVITFSIIATIILGLIVYFSFSKTVVTVTLNPQQKSTSFTAEIKKNLTDEDRQRGATFAGYLVTTDAAGSQTFTNAAEGKTVEAQATGTVTIYNDWTTEQPLAATTRLLTPDGVLFRIKNRVDVPSGGTVENVEVYADQPGPTGDIGPTEFTIPGLWPGLQDTIYAESKEAMTGGLRDAKVVTQESINAAKKELTASLIKEAAAKLEQTDELKKNQDKINQGAVTTIVLSEKTSAEAGAEADSFELTMSLRVIAIIFSKEQLRTEAIAQLKEEIAKDEQIKIDKKEALNYTAEGYSIEEQTATLAVRYSADVTPRLSHPLFNRENIAGKDRQEIQAYFSNFDEIKTAEVTFSPFWVRRAPTLMDHIEIELAE